MQEPNLPTWRVNFGEAAVENWGNGTRTPEFPQVWEKSPKCLRKMRAFPQNYPKLWGKPTNVSRLRGKPQNSLKIKGLRFFNVKHWAHEFYQYMPQEKQQFTVHTSFTASVNKFYQNNVLTSFPNCIKWCIVSNALNTTTKLLCCVRMTSWLAKSGTERRGSNVHCTRSL